ncbi:MAG TPA: hypothetical protein VHW00_15955 [Thermoanaerobaculia bacterium]|nr:hypothetical protein [Thermoanaerobaculia bacterium]
MRSRKRDLIVPIRDRRQRRRIVTLKNFRNVMIAAAAIFLAVTIYSETRGPKTGDYGRLYSNEMPAKVEPKPLEVVTEAASTAVPDATHADPTLVEPMARAQWLNGEEQATATLIAPASTTNVRIDPRAGGDVTIVGGPDGVTVVRGERRRPMLKGGFGR